MVGDFEVWTTDKLDEISGAVTSDHGAAVVRPWWPLTVLSWSTSDPEAFWTPSGIEWNFHEPYAPPRIFHEQLRWSKFEFGCILSDITLQAAFQNTA